MPAPVSQFERLEVITRHSVLSTGSFDEILKEIGSHLAECFQVERINIWLLKKQGSCIRCIGALNTRSGEFTKGDILYQKNIPYYFSHIMQDRILPVDDVMSDPLTAELKDTYCRKHHITSMMDVPIRIDGKLAGVVCYEHTGEKRHWTEEETAFAMTLNQVVAMAIEGQSRKAAQLRLQKALKQKEVLMAEMHHRVKNNLSILISLIRLQESNSRDKKVVQALEDTEHRIFSIMKIHQLLYATETYLTVNLKIYLDELLSQFDGASSGAKVEYRKDLSEIRIATDKAITLGLLTNEIISNSLKHAFRKKKKGAIKVKLDSKGDKIFLEIADNGTGFAYEKALKKGGLGLSLVNDLSAQLKGTLKVSSGMKGTNYQLVF